MLDGAKDWQWIAECWCYGFWAFGVRPTDTVFFAFSYGSFIGFWGAHYAARRSARSCCRPGNMTTEARVKQIVEMEATTVCATPTYALRMAQEARELGIDLPKQGKVQRVIVSGEPAGSIPATKKMIEEQWGAKCGDTAGMTELGTIMMFECAHQPGGTHIIEDHFIEEVIDPETREPVAYGERGERVVTSFGRGMIPVLRYRTRDLVREGAAQPAARAAARSTSTRAASSAASTTCCWSAARTSTRARSRRSCASSAAIDEFQILVEHVQGRRRDHGERRAAPGLRRPVGRRSRPSSCASSPRPTRACASTSSAPPPARCRASSSRPAASSTSARSTRPRKRSRRNERFPAVRPRTAGFRGCESFGRRRPCSAGLPAGRNVYRPTTRPGRRPALQGRIVANEKLTASLAGPASFA